MNTIETSLSLFRAVSLKELDNVRLMNRIDTKFVCGVSLLPEILNEISDDYSILEIEGKRIMRYRTNYFDTPDFLMYNEHQNGKLNRYKIREREYSDSDAKILEVKFKDNRYRTYKSRIMISDRQDQFTADELTFLQKNSPFTPGELEPKLINGYNRITLTNQIERVTIDFNLNFNCPEGNSVSIPALVIFEIKQNKFSLDSHAISILKKHNIRSGGFSKYCIGSMMLYNKLKSNRFKSKIQLLNKLTA